jgi:hypothetical protein
MKPTCRWRSWVIFPFFCWACCNPTTTAPPPSFFFFFPRRPTLFYLGVPDNENEITRSSVRRPHCRSNVTHLIHRLAVIFHLNRHRCYTFRNWPTFFFQIINFSTIRWIICINGHIYFFENPGGLPIPRRSGTPTKKWDGKTAADATIKRILLCIKV